MILDREKMNRKEDGQGIHHWQERKEFTRNYDTHANFM